ncbi:MAG: bifunctional nuclease family protein [Bacteroidales bacterium]|nr:bifunctional nuclease family protein [Bacteroidales bacterium]
MEKIPLYILAVTQQTNYGNAFNLILEEKNGPRKLAITIGMSEAQAIAIQLDGMSTARPLVYDFISQMARSFDIAIEEVIIANVEKGIFYSEVVCRRKGSTSPDDVIRIDARPSDAVAMALKFRCPIYTYEIVLKAAGIVVGDGDVSMEDVESTPCIQSLSTDKLKKMLQEAIRREDYELATKIRDEINKR